jgi:hypothetical protein
MTSEEVITIRGRSKTFRDLLVVLARSALAGRRRRRGRRFHGRARARARPPAVLNQPKVLEPQLGQHPHFFYVPALPRLREIATRMIEQNIIVTHHVPLWSPPDYRQERKEADQASFIPATAEGAANKSRLLHKCH